MRTVIDRARSQAIRVRAGNRAALPGVGLSHSSRAEWRTGRPTSSPAHRAPQRARSCQRTGTHRSAHRPMSGQPQHPARDGLAPVRDGLPMPADLCRDSRVGGQPELHEVISVVDRAHEIVAEAPALAAPAHRCCPEEAERVAGESPWVWWSRLSLGSRMGSCRRSAVREADHEAVLRSGEGGRGPYGPVPASGARD